MEATSSNSKENKTWQEDIYWNHVPCIRFSSHLTGDFQDWLSIPEKFASKLKKKLPEMVTLRGPSGVTWNIRLVIKDDTLFLADIGWQQFVKDHSLEENDLLIFQYDKESCFDVMLFDGSFVFCQKMWIYEYNR
ncbi:hypothetical protein SLE2022_154470 [Rubroshorea leprosula]